MDELRNPNNGGNQNTEELQIIHSKNGEEHQFFINDDIDSGCSTPYVSAPSSPGRSFNGYFYSAPASPMHYVLSSSAATCSSSSGFGTCSEVSISSSGSFEFEFSARFPSNGGVSSSTETGSMSSADELFLNGQIRPMKLSSHLQRPQILAPLLDLEVEDEEDDERKGLRDFQGLKREDSMVRGREIRLRNRSLHRRARSLSPLRNSPSQWHEDDDDEEQVDREEGDVDLDLEEEKQSTETPSTGETPCVSASSSRSSSSGRNSKRWVFLKEFLRSKSEGRGSVKEKIWHSISFAPAKEKKPSSASSSKERATTPLTSSSAATEKQKGKSKQQSVHLKKSVNGKPTNGVGKRRVPPSPHELLYTANRAQAEEMKKKTYLPYRQGLFGCLGFSSKGYGAMNAFTRSLNPVTSR